MDYVIIKPTVIITINSCTSTHLRELELKKTIFATQKSDLGHQRKFQDCFNFAKYNNMYKFRVIHKYVLHS
jgi:hypothetical protein